MDKRTVITCIYTVTESVYSSIQMNKDILTINNHWQDVSLCYQDKAAIGRSLHLILNSIILRSIRSPCVKTLPLKVALSCELYVSPSNLNNFILSELHRSLTDGFYYFFPNLLEFFEAFSTGSWTHALSIT